MMNTFEQHEWRDGSREHRDEFEFEAALTTLLEDRLAPYCVYVPNQAVLAQYVSEIRCWLIGRIDLRLLPFFAATLKSCILDEDGLVAGSP